MILLWGWGLLSNIKTIGEQIKSLRIERSLKQTDLADYLSITASTISNWENNRRLPSLEELRKLATLFNVSLAVFGEETEVEPKRDKKTSAMQRVTHVMPKPLVRETVYFLYGLALTCFVILPWLSGFGQALFFYAGIYTFLAIGLYETVLSKDRAKNPYKTFVVSSQDTVQYRLDVAQEETTRLLSQKRAIVYSVVLLMGTIVAHILLMITLFSDYAITWWLVAGGLAILALSFGFMQLQLFLSTPLFQGHFAHQEMPRRPKFITVSFHLTIHIISLIYIGVLGFLFPDLNPLVRGLIVFLLTLNVSIILVVESGLQRRRRYYQLVSVSQAGQSKILSDADYGQILKSRRSSHDATTSI